MDCDVEKLKRYIIKRKLEGQQVIGRFVFKQESVEKCSITGGIDIKQVAGKVLKKSLKNVHVERSLKNL